MTDTESTDVAGHTDGRSDCCVPLNDNGDTLATVSQSQNPSFSTQVRSRVVALLSLLTDCFKLCRDKTVHTHVHLCGLFAGQYFQSLMGRL